MNKTIGKAAHVHHSLSVAFATALVGPNRIFIVCHYIQDGKNALWLLGAWDDFHWPERDKKKKISISNLDLEITKT